MAARRLVAILFGIQTGITPDVIAVDYPDLDTGEIVFWCKDPRHFCKIPPNQPLIIIYFEISVILGFMQRSMTTLYPPGQAFDANSTSRNIIDGQDS
jgi:hypothetical protein